VRGRTPAPRSDLLSLVPVSCFDPRLALGHQRGGPAQLDAPRTSASFRPARGDPAIRSHTPYHRGRLPSSELFARPALAALLVRSALAALYHRHGLAPGDRFSVCFLPGLDRCQVVTLRGSDSVRKHRSKGVEFFCRFLTVGQLLTTIH
jgi:hypothetical protein